VKGTIELLELFCCRTHVILPFAQFGDKLLVILRCKISCLYFQLKRINETYGFELNDGNSVMNHALKLQPTVVTCMFTPPSSGGSIVNECAAITGSQPRPSNLGRMGI
jgi:hypothetical protein